MNQASVQRSFWPDVLRVVASLAVVMIHVHSWDFKPLNPTDQSGYLLIDLYCYWSVPVFVMLSGGLLLRPARTQASSLILPPDTVQAAEPPAVFFRKRWRRMIRPTLVWAGLAVIWGVGAKGQGADETLKRLATGVPNDPQWFLFMLLGLYALTPWLRILLANPQFNRYWLAGLVQLLYAANFYALVQQFAGLTVEPVFPINALTYLDLYLFGIIVSDPEAWSLRTDRTIWAASLAVTAVATLLAVSNPALVAPFKIFLTHYHSPLVLLQAVAVFRLAVRLFPDVAGQAVSGRWRGGVSLLADWSFGIYVIHPFVLTVLFKFFLRPIDGPFLPYCLVVWAVTMLVSCLGCLVLRYKPVTSWIIP